MRYSARLQAFVEALLRHHSILESALEMHLRLGEHEHLVVSHTADGRQIRLSRFTLYANAARKELEIMFFVDEEGHWIPYEYVRPFPGRQVCGVVNRREQSLVLSNPLFQRGLVIQCDLWATRLKNEGWLEHGIKVDANGQESDGLMVWPIPTVDQPNDDQLEAWLMDVEVCESTDGCPVDMDGTCPHGFPSWLRYLGLV
jgi:hypothetical protein